MLFLGKPCEREGYFRYKNSCNLHYNCYYSKTCGKLLPSKIYQCPGCLKFNPRKMICDLPQNVPECNYHEEHYQKFENHKVTKPIRYCTKPGKYLDPSNRKRYYDCIDIFQNGKYYLTIKNCPINTTFDDTKKMCKGYDKRLAEKFIIGSCRSNNYAIDQYNCQKFYFCQNQLPIAEMFCLKTHFFNGKVCQKKSMQLS